MRRKQNGFLLFIASCIPGCGEMYQGYMKRGISILTAFCALFALAIFLEIGALAVLMLPIWLFSFFDSYNIRAQSDEEAHPDAYLFGLSDMDAKQMSALFQKRHSLIGWLLVLVGICVLWQTAAGWLSSLAEYIFGWDWSFYYLFYRDIPRMAVTVFIIGLGLWFIRGPKAKEEIPAFTPPAGPEETAVPEDAKVPEQEDTHGEQ